MDLKRKNAPTEIPIQDESDVLKITPLGAGQEVGRSCILLEYKNKVVMLDCGLHPAYNGLAALPFFDNIDPATIDVLLLTHFHIDHAAGLPYFMEKTTFKGRVFMTHPTKAIYKWLLSDYLKVSNLAVEDMLYDEKDLMRSYERIETIDFHQEMDVDGIKFTPYNAGHVLGAAMFLIEIAGVRVLYTGDYSREEDRHLMAAERPPNVVPDVLITESTYGVQHHRPRQEREYIFTSTVHSVVQRGGRCLIPVFALGRAQELLLILDEYWQAHPELHNVPIYYVSSLAKKCHFDDVGPCVMMASPGMLQSGLSRELLELWCVDKRNGVIIPGYVVEGTLAKQILNQPEDIISMAGTKLPLKLSVEYVSFSAHVDFAQNSQFIEEVGSPHLVLVHGDQNEMGRLKSALASKYAEKDEQLNIYTPKNCETIELYFRGEKMAKIIGRLAHVPPKQNTVIEALVVSRDFTYHIMAPEDLKEFTDLTTTTLEQRLVLPHRAPVSLIRWHLEQMYGMVEDVDDDAFVVFKTVKVTDLGGNRLLLEWEGTSVNDMIADSLIAIVMQSEFSPASVKATRVTSCSHSHRHASPPKISEVDTDEVKEEEEIKVKVENEDETKIKSEPVEENAKKDNDVEMKDADAPGSSDDVQTKDESEVKTEDAKPSRTLVRTESGAVLEVNEAEQLARRIKFLSGLLHNHFGKERIHVESIGEGAEVSTVITVKLDDEAATVTIGPRGDMSVTGTSEEMRRRVSSVVNRVRRTLEPIASIWTPPSVTSAKLAALAAEAAARASLTRPMVDPEHALEAPPPPPPPPIAAADDDDDD
ncbi:Cleavage and polyadenylation specificity factor subunit 3 [Phlyctochytrium bullatum]|nr:Cleavage and polyadenylation specificity factor subunit 3 [Phlyctochytrium bullatum]